MINLSVDAIDGILGNINTKMTATWLLLPPVEELLGQNDILGLLGRVLCYEPLNLYMKLVDIDVKVWQDHIDVSYVGVHQFIPGLKEYTMITDLEVLSMARGVDEFLMMGKDFFRDFKVVCTQEASFK